MLWALVEDGHWVRWHQAYEDPAAPLSRRLAAVQRRLRDALDNAPRGPIRVISMCAGDGRDLLGVLPDHPRREDVAARLVELDPDLVSEARCTLQRLGLPRVEVVEGDASGTSAYIDAVPADVVLVCGVFGNISDEDVHRTINELAHLVAAGAVVIWTRHRRPPDLTTTIRRWFTEAGFEEVGFDKDDRSSFGVGTNRFCGVPLEPRPGRRMFVFFGDGLAGHT